MLIQHSTMFSSTGNGEKDKLSIDREEWTYRVMRDLEILSSQERLKDTKMCEKTLETEQQYTVKLEWWLSLSWLCPVQASVTSHPLFQRTGLLTISTPNSHLVRNSDSCFTFQVYFLRKFLAYTTTSTLPSIGPFTLRYNFTNFNCFTL